MEKHIKVARLHRLLSWLYALAVLGFLLAAFAPKTSQNPVTIYFLLILFLVLFFLHHFIAIGARERNPWARKASEVVAVLMLIFLPIGTLIGVYLLINTWPPPIAASGESIQDISDQGMLYAELKPLIEAVSLPLLNFSEKCIRDQGDFLPHAAVATTANQIELVGVKSENEMANSAETMPLLHRALRALAAEKSLSAVGVAENVTVSFPQQNPTKAIKVLFEHRNGLTTALYLPYEKSNSKGYIFGTVRAMFAKPEVRAW